jgi:excisionase family DNA binding protein
MGRDNLPSVPEWMSPEQAAAVSGFSTKTIYRALWCGELRASKRRRRWRIRHDVLVDWIDGEHDGDVLATARARGRKAAPKGSLGAMLDALEGEAA